jgi:hypothetical protein
MVHVKLTSATAIAILALCFTGCSFAPLPSATGPPARDLLRGIREKPADRGPFLYVAGGEISEYRLGSSSPLHSVAPTWPTAALALDSAGNLFAANETSSWGALTVYKANDLQQLRMITGQDSTSSLAVNGQGYVYAGTCGAAILVFRPGGRGRGPVRIIRRGASGACSIAFDSSGSLYAGNSQRRSVSVFAPARKPGAMRFIRGITRAVNNPFNVLLSRSGRLVVANCPSCGYTSPKMRDSISVYAPGRSSPDRVIETGIQTPRALAVDSKGRLYVANVPFSAGTFQPGWISVYAPGINVATALAVDGTDNLYVANAYGNAVTVYSPGGAKLLYTITDGVSHPEAVVIGSP